MMEGDVEQIIIRCQKLARTIEDDGVMLGQSLRSDLMSAYQNILCQEKELLESVEKCLRLAI